MEYISKCRFPNRGKYIYIMKQEVVYIGAVVTKQLGTASSIDWLNKHILEYVTDVYGPFGFSYQSGNKDITVNGMLINTEYIDKMVNNRKVMINIANSQSINKEEEFYNYMVANLFDIYHYNGSHFMSMTLPTLIECTRKGNIGELLSLRWMESQMFAKGVNAVMEEPTLLEDVDGIDGKFQWNGRYITIQVKPFGSIVSNGKTVSAYTSGTKKIKLGSTGKPVDYLIIYKPIKDADRKTVDVEAVCVRGSNVGMDKSNFVFDMSNIVFKKTSRI